jgi:multicomponent K+:H+ antiporter subunit D
MMSFPFHIVIAPILVPLITAALLLFFDERQRVAKAAISLASTVILLVVAILLFREVNSTVNTEIAAVVSSGVYLLGNWPAPFGIVLVLDQLSALMLVLTSVLALASLVFSLARWHRAGVHFHPLFQFLLMGLNGAFLTGDLFNLFVFFEVLLAASYGLVLHGSGLARVKAGMHYIVVNLATSFLFLIGVSLIYGVTGTLNMADLAARIPQVSADDRMLLEAGGAILGIAFLVKAGMWPLSFWLPTTYTAAAPPVAAIFAVMSKVGIYIVLRLWLLLFGNGAAESAQFGESWLLYGGLITIAFGMMGVLATQNTARLAGYAVLVSSGTLLAAIGLNQVEMTAGALFYLVSSTLTISALFLLIELVERGREMGADMLAVTREAYGEPDDEDSEDEEAGFAIPATMALLGISFLSCAVLLAGLPPLSGFIAKFAMLSSIFSAGLEEPHVISAENWAFVTLLILSSLSSLIAMTRAGIRSLWASEDREVPRVRIIEMAPVAVLLLLSATLTLQAGPAMRYMESAARALHNPAGYIQGVLTTPPSRGIPGAAQ